MKIEHTLPFGLGDLTPHISEITMYLHFAKHHQGYVNNYNNGLTPDLDGMTLEEVLSELMTRIKNGDVSKLKLFQNGAQAFNHDFFWHSINPKNKTPAPIDRDLFVATGVGHFGSGWLWVVRDSSGNLDLCTTSNEDSPQFSLKSYSTIKGVPLDQTEPVLVCDLWEHGYYLDYQNRRADFLKMMYDNLLDWSKCEEI
jgi:Fe-Mn family superoxide dismutase